MPPQALPLSIGSLIKSVLGIDDPKPVDTRPQAEASKYSADLIYKSSQEARELQREQFKQGREWLEPWFRSGRRALAMLELGSQQGQFQLPEWVGRELLPDRQRNRLYELRRKQNPDRSDTEQARFEELQARVDGQAGGANIASVIFPGASPGAVERVLGIQTGSGPLSPDEQREYERLGGNTRNRARLAELEAQEKKVEDLMARRDSLPLRSYQRNQVQAELDGARFQLRRSRQELNWLRENADSALTFEETRELERLEQAGRERLADEDVDEFRGSLIYPEWEGFDREAPEYEKFTQEHFEADPGYRYRQAEAERALRRQAAVQGSSGGGRHLNALLAHSQQMASDEFDRARKRHVEDYGLKHEEFERARARAYHDYSAAADRSQVLHGRLSEMAGTGQAQSHQLAALGQNYANTVGQLNLYGAQALGAGRIGAANANVQGQLINNQVRQVGNENTLAIWGTAANAAGAYWGA